MSEGWIEKRLSECFRLKSGDGLTSKQMKNGDYPVYGGNGVAGAHNEFNLSGDNVIVGRVGALCGNARHITDKIWLTDNAFNVVDYKYDFENDFLTYLLNYKNLRRLARQAAQPVISNTSLKDLILNFPESIEEQKRIVAILDEAFAGIDTAIANTEKNLANARELFESYLNSVFTQKGDGWIEKKFGDADLIQIIDGDRGVNYPKKADFMDNGFCLFLNTKNVRPDGFNFDTTMFISEEKDNALRKGKLKRRDVILTTRGTIGNIAVYDDSVDFDEIRINSGMLIFRPNENVILSEYLFEILRSGIMKSQTERFVSGAAQPQLPIKTLVNFSIPVPVELTDQKQIVDRLKELSGETNRLEAVCLRKLEALAELKQSILQKAFSGELTEDSNKLMDEAVA
jgi:type I restriction enzyme S subunit